MKGFPFWLYLVFVVVFTVGNMLLAAHASIETLIMSNVIAVILFIVIHFFKPKK